MVDQRDEELKKLQGEKKEEPETEAPQVEDFLTDDYRDEKKDLLGREEIRTMKKDISSVREAEAQKEKERMISFKVGEGQEGLTHILQKKEALKKENELRAERERKEKEEEKAKEAEMRRIEEARKAEEARSAEEKRKIDEARRMEEMKRAKEAERLAEIKKAEEQRRVQEAKRLEEIRRVEELKRAEEARRAEAVRRAEEIKKIEEVRRVEEARRAQEARRMEEIRKAEEARRAEAVRRAEEIKKLEEAKRVEEVRRIEEARKAEEARRAEEKRRAETAQMIEGMRRAGEGEKAAEIKRAEDLRKIEEARRAEEMKITENAEAMTETRRAEEARLIEETKKLRELELAAEVKEAQETERARESKEKEIKRTKELEEILEEEGDDLTQSPEIFQEISSFKPEEPQLLSSLKKVLIRFAIVSIIIILEIFAGFLYWYLTILPMETEQPQIQQQKQRETITVPPALIDARTTITIEASSSEYAALLLPQYLEKNPETSGFARILIKNNGEKKVFELSDFFSAFKISPPAGLLEKLDKGFTLFVHSDNNSGRFGFVAKIKENEQENVGNIMTSWEPTMEKDFENIFSSLGKNKTAYNRSFIKATYKGASFRYISFPTYHNFGICWSTFNNYFLWTCSGESMMRTIDALSE